MTPEILQKTVLQMHIAGEPPLSAEVAPWGLWVLGHIMPAVRKPGDSSFTPVRSPRAIRRLKFKDRGPLLWANFLLSESLSRRIFRIPNWHIGMFEALESLHLLTTAERVIIEHMTGVMSDAATLTDERRPILWLQLFYGAPDKPAKALAALPQPKGEGA